MYPPPAGELKDLENLDDYKSSPCPSGRGIQNAEKYQNLKLGGV